jgi:hypothetical protein
MRLKPLASAWPQALRSSGALIAAAACRVSAASRLAFAEPFQQGIAAQRDADRVARVAWKKRLQTPQDPVDLVAVAGVVGARQAIALARTTPEIHHHACPADGLRPARIRVIA